MEYKIPFDSFTVYTVLLTDVFHLHMKSFYGDIHIYISFVFIYNGSIHFLFAWRKNEIAVLFGECCNSQNIGLLWLNIDCN